MTNDQPRAHATEKELGLAVQENMFALFRAMTVLPGSESVQTDRLCYHLAFPTNPMFKGIWGTRLSPDEVEPVMDETIAWFAERNAPYLFWWIGPDTEPADIGERLLRRGFTENIAGDQGMAIDLRTLKDSRPVPDGFTIVRAVDQKTLDDWRDVFTASFGVPLFTGQAWADATWQAGAEDGPWTLYVGYLDGKPVATSILFNGAGVAGLYGIATLPEARRKGIGAAITLRPLLEARAMGYNFGVLYASDLGHSVYRGLGFFDVPCKIGRYLLWRG